MLKVEKEEEPDRPNVKEFLENNIISIYFDIFLYHFSGNIYIFTGHQEAYTI